MNLPQLVFKQMRQRALSTSLTLLSVLLGVALSVAILVFQREGGKLFGATEFGHDMVIGAKGSKLQLVLNTTYHVGVSPGNIPYALYESLPGLFGDGVRWAVPLAVGDNYQGYRILGTTPAIFTEFEYRPERRFALAAGRAFAAAKFEAVIGSDVAAKTGLKLGDQFRPTHGLVAENRPDQDEHEEQWTVVGILAPTHTAHDRVIFIPLESFFAIGEHGSALEAMAELEKHPATTAPHKHNEHHEHHEHEKLYTLAADGTIDLKLPKEKWKLSAILLRTKSSFEHQSIAWRINNGPSATAANPAWEMREFFNTFLKGSSYLLLAVSLLVTVVAAVSILVSIYNSIVARSREIAILRALGATRRRIVSLICFEALLIGLAGGLLGLLAGHALAGGASVVLQRLLGEGIDAWTVGPWEWLYLLAVAAIALLAGLVPALKAYRTPVAENLVSV